jgi:hypothetical protein
MGLLNKHVSELKSEELVLGTSGGWHGEVGSKNEGKQSTKIIIVSQSGKKDWNGFTAIEHGLTDASIGEGMKGKQFPARCVLTYRRLTVIDKKTYEGKTIESDVEKLVVIGVEYVCPVDFIDLKVQKVA